MPSSEVARSIISFKVPMSRAASRDNVTSISRSHAYLLLVFGLLRRGRLLHLLLGQQKIDSRESAVRNTASRKGKARVRAQTCSQCGDFLFEAHAASPGREVH